MGENGKEIKDRQPDPDNVGAEESVTVAINADFEEKLMQTEAKLLELQDAFLRAKADG